MIRVSFLAQLPVQTRRWIRNTRAPAAELQNTLANLVNYAAYVRSKPVFQQSTNLADIPDTTASTRDRWRFAFHTTPWADGLKVQFLMARRNDLVRGTAIGKLTIYDAAGTVAGVATMVYGGSGFIAPSDVPAEFGTSVVRLVTEADPTVLAVLKPDADYFATFTDLARARLISAAVWEVPQITSESLNYVPNTQGAGAAIFDLDRAQIAENARLLHRRYAAQLWNWTVDVTPRSLTATETNLVDGASTSVSTTTPGAVLDLSNRVTMRTTAQGVPVVMWAYFANVSSSAQVLLKNSAGTALVTVDAPYTDGWGRGVGYLPASSGKYDLHAVSTGVTADVSAVSLYELDYTPQTMSITFATVQATRQINQSPKPASGVGDWTATVAIYDGTQSNVVVIFTMPRNNAPSTGADPSTVSYSNLEYYNPGWTVTGTTTSTDLIYTFTATTLTAGNHTITMAARIDAIRSYAVDWDDIGSFDVVATGSSNDVPAATGDTTTIATGNLSLTAAWSPTPTTTGTPTTLTLTIAPTALSSSGHSITITINDAVTTTSPTTTANPDGWTVGAWSSPGGGTQWAVTLTKAGSITAGSTSTITFSTTPSTAGDMSAICLLTAANDFGGGQEAIVTVSSGSSSLTPIAALLTGAP